MSGRLAPVKDPQIRQLDVQVYGDRNAVLGRARIPEALLGEFEAAWLAFRAAYPHYTMEAFVRYVYQKGLASAVHAVVQRHIPAPKAEPL